MSKRKDKFIARHQRILQTAEAMLLESGDYRLILDELAKKLQLAKGTLYRHFTSKDELILQILINYEKKLLTISQINDGASAGVTRMILQQLIYPQKTAVFHVLEEYLAGVTTDLKHHFNQLYEIRQQRMQNHYTIAQTYLNEQNSTMNILEYLAVIWTIGHGGAGLLNSSFYQQYLGSRKHFVLAIVLHILNLPKYYQPALPMIAKIEEKMPKERLPPKLIKPLLPPVV